MDVELYVREAGSGTPLVLLHAFPLNSAMWLPQREGLADVCRVITPDLRGFGGSPLGADVPSLDASADDVARCMDSRSIDSVVLGGLSMGGYIAMALLRRHPDRVRALVLADTKAGADPEAAVANRERIASLLDADPHDGVLVDEVLPTLVGTTTTQQRAMVLGRIKALVQAAPPRAVSWVERAMAARPDSFDTLRAFDKPALVIVGEEDLIAPVADASAMTEALPRGRLVAIAGAGHLTAVETPGAFNDAVRAFLADVAT